MDTVILSFVKLHVIILTLFPHGWSNLKLVLPQSWHVWRMIISHVCDFILFIHQVIIDPRMCEGFGGLVVIQDWDTLQWHVRAVWSHNEENHAMEVWDVIVPNSDGQRLSYTGVFRGWMRPLYGVVYNGVFRRWMRHHYMWWYIMECSVAEWDITICGGI